MALAHPPETPRPDYLRPASTHRGSQRPRSSIEKLGHAPSIAQANVRLSQHRASQHARLSEQSRLSNVARHSSAAFTDYIADVGLSMPSAEICEAVGMEIAVRAWWRGTPGAGSGGGSGATSRELVWLRSTVAGGASGAARSKLQRCGISDKIIEGGLQVGEYLLQDEQTRQIWARCRHDEAKFISKLVAITMSRFDIHTVPLFWQEKGAHPSLVLAPRNGSAASTLASTPLNYSMLSWDEAATDRGAWSGRPATSSPKLKGPHPKPHSARQASGRSSAPPALIIAPPVRRHSLGTSGTASTYDHPPRAASVATKREAEDSGSESKSPEHLDLAGSKVTTRPEYGRAATTPDAKMASASRAAPHPIKIPGQEDRQLTFSWGSKTTEHLSPGRPGSLKGSKGYRGSSARRSKTAPSNFDLWLAKQEHVSVRQQNVKDANNVSVKEKNEAKPPIISNKAAKKVTRDMTEIRRIFNEFDKDQSGHIDPQEFPPLLSRLMRQPTSEMDMSEVWSHWNAIDEDGSGHVSLDEFQTWYCEKFHIDCCPDFTEFITRTLVPEDQRCIREVARNLKVDNVEIEKIWSKFVKLDQDSSGTIDRSEFGELVSQQLTAFTYGRATGCTSKKGPGGAQQLQVPEKMLDKFWNDIDADGSGQVTFEEFAHWYVKVFISDISPMEQYYQSLGSGYRSHCLDHAHPRDG
eukprot:gnl/TRDRNA2_/TRDRNA2_160104_c3_seq1.p1 gnl/TRDRNA2_/TRDRNA2_160104_c3~~gnl/TRDRNA2_/TRDRNA2_160104_c3_seq1.p1  ORF type:complete len:694 (-),score=100.85 gnl/TRDRNA2_/TRDRNA2_160104_c3_seq1:128-2209(-)